MLRRTPVARFSAVLLTIGVPLGVAASGCAGGFDFGMKTSADRRPEPPPPPRTQWPAQRPARAGVDEDAAASAHEPRAMTIQTSDRERADAAMLERCPDGFEVDDLHYRDSTSCSRPRAVLPRSSLFPTARCERVNDVVIRFHCETRHAR